MKWLVFILLLGLGACQSGGPRPPASGPDWGLAMADSLYARRLLSQAGRDELKQQVRDGRLASTYSLPGTARYGQLPAATPAAVLQFCAQAFQAAQLPRAVEMTPQREQELRAALRQKPVDTVALQRQAYSSVEQTIATEDPPVRAAAAEGWTIYPPLGLGFQKDLVAASRSVFGKTRTRTARDLYALGLLSRPDYEQVQQGLAAQQLATEAAVCQQAAQLALARFTQPARRIAFDSLLLRLRQANVLTASGQQRALADPRVRSELGLDALLPYCQPVRVLTGLPRAPLQLYPQLLAEAASLLPAFRYSAARAQLTETPSDGGTAQEVTLSFKASGRRYTNHLRLGWQPAQRSASARRVPYIDADALAGINQWLRDQHAPGRLYLAYLNIADDGEGDEVTRPQYALALLTPAQLAAWGEPGSFAGPEPGASASQFTSARIEAALALYQRLGLLAGLPPAEVAEGRRQALSGTASSYPALVQCFPSLVVEMGGEDAEEPRAYAKTLARVAAATRGAFRPRQVRDDFPGQQARKQKSAFSFGCGPRHYRATFISDLGWMDWGFVTLTERAVRENTPGRLYYLSEGDETGLYFYLTPTQAAALRQVQPELFAADDAEQASKQKKP